MIELIASGWKDYELLDSGEGLRLERFNEQYIVRPDPNILWKKSSSDHRGWLNPTAEYTGKSKDDNWLEYQPVPKDWTISYKKARFALKLTPFRHVGIFPEQRGHWDWIEEVVSGFSGKHPKVLNLFAYTGASSVIAALSGGEVCHVDASKSSIMWAKDNAQLSGLPDTAIRWIVDDVLKFLRREVRRGSKYDLIIMDPPVFGRGPKGEIWRLEERVKELAELTAVLLSKQPLGVLVNFYATALYPQSIQRVFTSAYQNKGIELKLGSLVLEETLNKKTLPTGFFLRS